MGKQGDGSWWERLSGGELRARLTQRGVTAAAAEALVRDREGELATRLIDRALGRDD